MNIHCGTLLFLSHLRFIGFVFFLHFCHISSFCCVDVVTLFAANLIEIKCYYANGLVCYGCDTFHIPVLSSHMTCSAFIYTWAWVLKNQNSKNRDQNKSTEGCS